jgi:hypothetical protein
MTQPHRKSPAKYSIYWCTTPDGQEDWFVVAPSADAARRYHEEMEGYCEGTASAEPVAALPAHLISDKGYLDPADGHWSVTPSWPSDRLLRACGAEVFDVRRVNPDRGLGPVYKSVQFADRIFRTAELVSCSFRLLRSNPSPTRLPAVCCS